MNRRDWITDLGIVAVGLAAAILTFSTLTDLAVACGIVGSFLGVPLQMLVPVTIDAAGVVAARVWLRRTAGDEAVAYARKLAWACIAASVLGNAGQHGMAAYGVVPPWFVVVVVSAVPPAMLGAVVHLGHLIGRARTEKADEPAGRPATEPEVVAQVVEDPTPVVPAPPKRRARKAPAVDQPVDEDKLRDLIAKGTGRGELAKELNITPHRARVLLDQRRVNGHAIEVTS